MKLKATMACVLLWALNEATANESGNLTVYKELPPENEQAVHLHSRRKRYIVFPKGSSLQLLLEVLVHVPTRFPVVIGPTLQMSWELPTELRQRFRARRSPLVHNSGLREHMLHFKNFFNFSSVTTRETPPGKKYKVFSDVATLLDLMGITLGLAWRLPDDPMIHREFKRKHKIYKRNALKKVEDFFRPSGANGRQCVLKALCESGQRTPSKKEFLREILHKIFSVEADDGDLEENEEDALYRKAHQSVNQNCDTLYPDCQFSLFNSI